MNPFYESISSASIIGLSKLLGVQMFMLNLNSIFRKLWVMFFLEKQVEPVPVLWAKSMWYEHLST